MLKSNRYCVTGGTGFIGSHLVKYLEDNGYDGISCVGHHPDLLVMENCYEVVNGCDVVFHCAGVTAGAGVVRGDPLALVHDNLVLAANMLEASYRSGVKAFIFPSSTTGYPAYPHAVREDEYNGSLFEGYRTIGTVKRFIEDLSNLYPMTCIALRISNVFGDHDQFDPVRSHVIQANIRKVVERQDPLVCWGDGEDVRDALHVDDVVESMIRAAEFAENNTGFHAFNIGRGKGYSIKEILKILIGFEGYSPNIVYDETKPSLLKKRLVNVDKAKKLLGWEAKISMEDALTSTLDWYRANRDDTTKIRV